MVAGDWLSADWLSADCRVVSVNAIAAVSVILMGFVTPAGDIMRMYVADIAAPLGAKMTKGGEYKFTVEGAPRFPYLMGRTIAIS